MVNITSEFPKTFQIADFTMSSSVSANTTDYVDVATYTVPPKQRIFFGNGKINLGVDDRGTMKLDFNTNSPADIAGVARLVLRDANAIQSRFIREDISADFEAGVKVGKGGKTGNEPQLLSVQEDEDLVIQFRADSSADISKADSSINLPVTIQTLQG